MTKEEKEEVQRMIRGASNWCDPENPIVQAAFMEEASVLSKDWPL